MEIIGRVIAVLSVVSGTSSKGNAWQKGGFVIETMESYPKKIHFGVFGEERVARIPRIGDIAKVSFDIDSHEFEGRWFTNVNAFKIELAGSTNSVTLQQPTAISQNQATAVQNADFPQKSDDLPF